VSAPGPAQSGIISSCNKYAEASGGIGCDDFATANGITPEQLFAWNNVLGPNGENCGTSFWDKEWYCVGIDGDASSMTSATSAAPETSSMTTQAGIVRNGDKSVKATGLLGCYDFATQNSRFELSSLYQWNALVQMGRSTAAAFWQTGRRTFKSMYDSLV
jgi:hypothetical protein